MITYAQAGVVVHLGYADTYTRTQIHTGAYMICTHIHPYIHTQTDIHTHAHMHACRLNRVVMEVAGERSQRFLNRTFEVLVEGVNPRNPNQVCTILFIFIFISALHYI